MTTQLSRRHHFVPKFLLRPWLVKEPTGHYNLLGYWWNPRRRALDCKRRGLDSFCNQLDLLTLNGHALGKDAIEKIFFGSIDDLGSKARDALVDSGQSSLSHDQRCHFARLLLSLDARRPANIRKLRAFAAYAAHELNTDPEVTDALYRNGITTSASEYVANRLGWSLEDRGLGKSQDFVDNPEVGGKLINSFWHVRHTDENSGSLILSDRPLIRVNAYNRPGAAWVLPLTPTTTFIACSHESNMEKLLRLSDERFVKETNRSSVGQAERFVFCVDRSHSRWIERHLKPSKAD